MPQLGKIQTAKKPVYCEVNKCILRLNCHRAIENKVDPDPNGIVKVISWDWNLEEESCDYYLPIIDF